MAKQALMGVVPVADPEPTNLDETRVLGRSETARSNKDILREVHQALKEKGYDPIRQIAYYLVTGEPVYITAHRNARSLASRLERDEVIEELVAFYLEHDNKHPQA